MPKYALDITGLKRRYFAVVSAHAYSSQLPLFVIVILCGDHVESIDNFVAIKSPSEKLWRRMRNDPRMLLLLLVAQSSILHQSRLMVNGMPSLQAIISKLALGSMNHADVGGNDRS